ncbi:MAG TPA: hypothetical protein VD948_01785 [Rhodothermales bacterium]|nr:hypothetical protein [Rhodothermales bacterium]
MLGAFVLTSALSAALQPALTFNDGYGWDGVEYAAVTRQLADGAAPEARAPFVYRLGTPFLVATLFGDDVIQGFRVVNLVANGLAVLLLVVWLRLHLADWRVRVAMALVFMLAWHGPIRFVHYYPVYVDPALFVFLLAGLIVIHHARVSLRTWHVAALCGIVFVGALFREVALVVALAFLFVRNPLRWQQDSLLLLDWSRSTGVWGRLSPGTLLPLGCGLLALTLTRTLGQPTDRYSFGWTAFGWLYAKPLLTWVHACFVTFGPVLFVVLYDVRALGRFLAGYQPMAVVLTVLAALSWIGGSETERLLFWSASVMLVLVGKALEHHRAALASWPLLFALWGTQGWSSRVGLLTPDYPSSRKTPLPLLTIPAHDFNYLHLYSYYSPPYLSAIALAQYVALCALLLWWTALRRRRMDARAVTLAAA